MAHTEKEVLRSIREGNDDHVLSYLYRNVLPKVKSYIIKNNGGEADAKDIFQDAVLIFYRHVKLGKYNEENEIAGFIFSVSRNLWINLVKKKNRTMELTEEAFSQGTGGDVSEHLITREREEFINRMFSLLGETCRTLLVYSIYHRLSMKEIKEKMGFTSENVAKTKHYKCKQRLIDIVQDNASVKDMLQG